MSTHINDIIYVNYYNKLIKCNSSANSREVDKFTTKLRISLLDSLVNPPGIGSHWRTLSDYVMDPKHGIDLADADQIKSVVPMIL